LGVLKSGGLRNFTESIFQIFYANINQRSREREKKIKDQPTEQINTEQGATDA